MLRKILVPLIGRDCDRSVLAMGFSVAKTFDAHVEALHVGGDPRDMVPMLGDGLSGPMIEEIMKASEQEFAADAEIARKHFEAARAAAQAALVQSAPGPGMASGRMRSVTGVMEDVLPHEARLADLVSGHLGIALDKKQDLLDTLDVAERLEKVYSLMQGEMSVLQVEKKIKSRVKTQMEKTQREYYLNEQMKAIQKELGDGEEGQNEVAELEERIGAIDRDRDEIGTADRTYFRVVPASA